MKDGYLQPRSVALRLAALVCQVRAVEARVASEGGTWTQEGESPLDASRSNLLDVRRCRELAADLAGTFAALKWIA